LRANAWHSRSDALSSVVVLVGVAGALFGFVLLDAIAAVFVGVMVMRMGWKLGWSSIKELVDTGLELSIVKEINAIILTVPGVLSIHQLRTRLMGCNVLIDVHVLVDSTLSVSEGHFIGDSVRRALQETNNDKKNRKSNGRCRFNTTVSIRVIVISCT